MDVAAAQEAVVLAVCGQNFSETPAFQHGLAHQALALDALAVIGKCDHIRRHVREVCKALAALADGDRAVGVYMHGGALADQPPLHIQRRAAVGDGVKVRHRRDMRKAAVRRRQRPGADRLFIRKSRLTKMYMNIYETGK